MLREILYGTGILTALVVGNLVALRVLDPAWAGTAIVWLTVAVVWNRQ